MRALTDTLALLTMAAGVLVLACASFRPRALAPVFSLALEFWMAAELLRLVGDPTWSRIATAAGIVTLRKLIMMRRLSGLL